MVEVHQWRSLKSSVFGSLFGFWFSGKEWWWHGWHIRIAESRLREGDVD